MKSILFACTAVATAEHLAVASNLGLQRGLRTKKVTAPLEEDLEVSESLHSLTASRAEEREAFADPSDVSLASVSVLGLQRTATVRKRPSAISRAASPVNEVVSITLVKEPEPVTPSHPGELALSDVSLLGLQRSAKIVPRQPRKITAEPPKGATVKTATAAAALQDGLSLQDVSLLGLQRSAKVVRRPQASVNMGESLLGLQRSMKLTPRSAPGVMRKTSSLVEDDDA